MIRLIRIFIFFTNIFLFIKCDNLLSVQSNSINKTSAPYNEITGYASTNVEAYSNGNDSYTSNEYYHLYGIFMGMKWQCVEYARRWLFMRKGCVFSSIEGAADMWNELDHVQRIIDKKCFSLQKFSNGSPNPPRNESLLIYSRSGKDMPYGHVAVIVDVLPNLIRVAEENWDSYYWFGNYSREIRYELINGSYYIKDDYPILGWMTLQDNNQTKPLDQYTINNIIQLNGSSPDFLCSNHPIQLSFSIYLYLIFVLLFSIKIF